jgi:predicted choloylglycine hydrolase
MSENIPFPILHVSGSHYDIGFQVGRQFKKLIRKAMLKSPFYIGLKLMDSLKPEWFNELQANAEKFYPQYVEEMRGIADGARMKYRDIAIVNFRHSIKLEIPKIECSTLIFKKDDKILLAHNEDHEQTIRDYSYILIAKYEKGPTLFTYSYPGCIPGNSVSFSSHGIVMSGNALQDPDLKTGLPKGLLDHAMVEAKKIDNAVKICQTKGRSGGYSYNLVSQHEQKALNLETTTSRSGLTLVNDKYYRTNHYISNDLSDILTDNETNYRSLERYKRGMQLLPQVEKSAEGALKILSDDKVFVEMSKVTDSPLGEVYGGTHFTAIFEISKNDINLQFYPYVKNRENFVEFSLRDLKI